MFASNYLCAEKNSNSLQQIWWLIEDGHNVASLPLYCGDQLACNQPGLAQKYDRT